MALAVVGFLIYRSRQGKADGAGTGTGSVGAPDAYAGTASPAVPPTKPGDQRQQWGQEPNQQGQPDQADQPWDQDPEQRPPQNPGW